MAKGQRRSCAAGSSKVRACVVCLLPDGGGVNHDLYEGKQSP